MKLLLLLVVSIVSVNIYAYNADTAVVYANEHSTDCRKKKNISGVRACTKKWNTGEYPGVQKFDGQVIGATGCMIFVSECLAAGGFQFVYGSERYSEKSWYWDGPDKQGTSDKDSAYAWRSVKKFLKVVLEYNIFSDHAFSLEDPKKAKKGDLLFRRSSKNKDFSHVYIVTRRPYFNEKNLLIICVTAHTNDVRNKKLHLSISDRKNRYQVLTIRKKKDAYSINSSLKLEDDIIIASGNGYK